MSEALSDSGMAAGPLPGRPGDIARELRIVTPLTTVADLSRLSEQRSERTKSMAARSGQRAYYEHDCSTTCADNDNCPVVTSDNGAHYAVTADQLGRIG